VVVHSRWQHSATTPVPTAWSQVTIVVQVRRAISRLLAPSLQCKEFVHGELLRIAGQSAPADVARFPVLQVLPPSF